MWEINYRIMLLYSLSIQRDSYIILPRKRCCLIEEDIFSVYITHD